MEISGVRKCRASWFAKAQGYGITFVRGGQTARSHIVFRLEQ
jgi:hypothetical protein